MSWGDPEVQSSQVDGLSGPLLGLNFIYVAY